jgi:DNA replication protein DnaC
MDNKGRKRFFSTSKASADFIQFVITATGNRATLNKDNRINGLHKKTCYQVIQSKGNSRVSLVNDNAEIKAKFEKVKSEDGYKYCFTVETGYLILRRNGRIFITGNCGKSHICTAICGELLKKHEVRFMSWLTESVKLKQNVNNPEIYEPLMEEYKNCEVLYIDDFFKNENITSADLRIANEIINFRCVANKRTLISSERLVKDLMEIDEAVVGRMVEKAEEYLTEIVGKEKNYRLRQYL